jgi:hypothetical protein
VNLVAHVAVAERRDPRAPAPFLAGAVLPDLAAMARVRLGRGGDDALGDGIAFHHAADAAFHASRWFNDHNRALRDVLLDAGVDRGAARAAAHAGLEMLLDGGLAVRPTVVRATGTALAAVTGPGATREAVQALVPATDRSRWSEHLELIGRSFDARAYTSPDEIARRLHRMTSGRARIELAAAQVPLVARELAVFQPAVVADADAVVAEVATAV